MEKILHNMSPYASRAGYLKLSADTALSNAGIIYVVEELAYAGLREFDPLVVGRGKKPVEQEAM
jgi:hypothetical protein